MATNLTTSMFSLVSFYLQNSLLAEGIAMN
jgi:hypothetical protein